MSGWILPIALALAALAALLLLGKAPRKSWEALAATLVFGFIGFFWQAHPELPGSPKQAEAPQGKIGSGMVTVRQQLSGGGPIAQNHWIMTADALTRQGDFSNAAGYVLGAIEENPRDAQAWLALANNLVGHADGALTPAALYAFRQAASADPQAAGPPFFLGMALIQNGKPQEGRAMWAALLQRAPADAPWRQGLAERLVLLDQLIAQDAAAPGGKAPQR
ncbi:MAG: tetratricopeptide repeat protein [Novosphingobium sp.]